MISLGKEKTIILGIMILQILLHWVSTVCENLSRHNDDAYTVEPYNEDLGTMKITLLYQVSHIRVKKQKYKELGPAISPCYKRVLLYPTSL